MNLVVLLLIDSCLHCFDVWVMGEIDDEDTANGGTINGALLDKKADAMHEPFLPIA